MSVTDIETQDDLRTPEDIAADVDRGFALFATIAKAQKELKEVQARLEADALARPDEHEPLSDDVRDGARFVALGTALNLQITLTADKLMQSFAWNSPADKKVSSLAGDHFGEFFRSKRIWENRFKDGKAFRIKADELLGEKAPQFVAACLARDKNGIPKSDIKFQWKQAAADGAVEDGAEEEDDA